MLSAERADETRGEGGSAEERFIAEALQILAASLDYDTTLDRIVQLLVPSRADWALVDLLLEDGEHFERVAVGHHRAGSEPIAKAMKRVYPLTSPGGRGVEAAIREGRPQIIARFDENVIRSIARDEEHLRALRAMEVRSTVTVPLHAQGRPIGALTLLADGHVYDTLDAEFLQRFASAIAPAIENSRLFRAVVGARDRLERMQRVIAALSRAQTAEEVASCACRIGAEVMAAYSGAMWLLEPDGSLVLAGAWGSQPSFINQYQRLPPGSEAPAHLAVRTGEPVWIEHERDYERVSPNIYANAKAAGRVAAFGVVPMIGVHRPLGALTFAHHSPHNYDADQRSFYVALAQHCAQALERALLFDERKRSEAQFRLAIEAAPTAMIMVDRNGTIVLANEQVRSVFGYAPGEMVGQPLSMLIPSSMRGRHPTLQSDFFRDPKARPMGAGRDLFGIRKDGSEVAVEIGLTPLDTATGSVVLASIVDITERLVQRRRIELLQSVTAALSKAASEHDVLAVVVEEGTKCVGAPQGAVWLRSRDGAALQLAHSLGYRSASATAFGRIGLDVDAPVVRCVRERTSVWIESRADFAREFPAFERLGQQTSTEETSFFCVPLVLDDQCHGAMTFNWPQRRTFSNDERRLIEALALQAVQALERARLFDETARALEREQHARADAEQAARFAETFAGIVGHDLRNPLNAIGIGAQVILRAATDEWQRRRATAIVASAERMGRMVDQLLDFTRIRVGGGLKLEPVAMDLQDMAKVIIEETEATSGGSIETTFEGDSKGRWDPDRLAQVFSNLLGNAVRHGVAGHAIKLHLDGCNPESVVIVVENRGRIASEILPRIFEPFQGSESRKRSHGGGLGLGLYISHAIVTAHGGAIEAATTDDDVTRLRVALPRGRDVTA